MRKEDSCSSFEGMVAAEAWVVSCRRSAGEKVWWCVGSWVNVEKSGWGYRGQMRVDQQGLAPTHDDDLEIQWDILGGHRRPRCVESRGPSAKPGKEGALTAKLHGDNRAAWHFVNSAIHFNIISWLPSPRHPMQCSH